MTDNPSGYLLYGVPHSFYTGIVRSYLRTQGIAYQERTPAHPDFALQIRPVIQRVIVPVLVTPQGEIIQDSRDIIDHLEQQGVPYPAYPTGPLQQVLSIIIQYYGTQSMLRHAMHYRWSYLQQQEEFLRTAFSTGTTAAQADTVMTRMQSYLPDLGVTEQTQPLIEQSYRQLLDILNQHFAIHPYLFGGRPSVADYGLVGPLFAHLGRDPVPCQLMQLRAPKVFRWVERMLAPGLEVPEYPQSTPEFLKEDQVPDSLGLLLEHIAGEIFPELTDKLAFLDAHVSTEQQEDGAPIAAKPHQRHIGQVQTQFLGAPITAGVEPYLLYCLQRADAVMARCNSTEQARINAFLERYQLASALPGERGYRVERRNHLEVWARDR